VRVKVLQWGKDDGDQERMSLNPTNNLSGRRGWDHRPKSEKGSSQGTRKTGILLTQREGGRMRLVAGEKIPAIRRSLKAALSTKQKGRRAS